MKIDEFNDYIAGLRRTLTILLFVYFIVFLVSYAIVVQSVYIFGDLAYTLVVITMLSLTVVFTGAIIVLGLPLLQLEASIDDADAELFDIGTPISSRDGSS